MRLLLCSQMILMWSSPLAKQLNAIGSLRRDDILRDAVSNRAGSEIVEMFKRYRIRFAKYDFCRKKKKWFRIRTIHIDMQNLLETGPDSVARLAHVVALIGVGSKIDRQRTITQSNRFEFFWCFAFYDVQLCKPFELGCNVKQKTNEDERE